MTPYLREYLEIGEKCATTIARHFDEDAEAPRTSPAVILDFGCGLCRTLRFLRHDARWLLHGCDPDGQLIEWSASAFPDISFAVSAAQPPLPYSDSFFDGVYAISVFTHFDLAQQSAWQAELARILRPGGRLLLTSMGGHALGAFPNLNTRENRATLEDEGFLFIPGNAGFNSHGAFHSSAGIARIFGENFEVLSWITGGLDGFQDLSILRRS